MQKFVGRLLLTELRRDVDQLVKEKKLTKVQCENSSTDMYICSDEYKHLTALTAKGVEHAKQQLGEIGVLMLPAFDALTISLKDKVRLPTY